ncbi:MAG: hypothetical protein K0B01_01865 [Syntrophobacterales bacterium]|nr:hypothetical protein [Syntrophobacterales bacterium]
MSALVIIFPVLSSPVCAIVPSDDCLNRHEEFKKITTHASIACRDCQLGIKLIDLVGVIPSILAHALLRIPVKR